MEETNYDRVRASSQPSSQGAQFSEASSTEIEMQSSKGIERGKSVSVHGDPIVVDTEPGEIVYPRKTYWQRLSVVDKKRPNRMLDIFLAPFKGFTYPAVVYAGA